MKKINNKLIIIAIIFFIFGFFLQSIVSTERKLPDYVNSEDFALFWDVWETLEEKYPFDEPSEEDKRYEAIRGLVSAYDDEYSTFFPPEQSKSFQENISGQFVGAGMEIAIRDEFLTIIAPLKDSPAEIAGLMAGDIIISIDETPVFGQTLNLIVSRIRGEIGTSVLITVVRKGEKDQLDITVIRDIIDIPVLKTEIINNVFIISLYNFNEDSQNDFKSALKEFKDSKSKYLLIDLRNNPGGLLFSSVDIASYFLPQGEIVVKEDFGDSGKKPKIYRSKGFDLLKGVDYELGILINQGSASASEIIAGALQDHNKAIIMGGTSFGKGSVQELIEMDQKTSLKITIGRWLTPNDRYISKEGIIPDIKLEGTEDFQIIRTEALKVLKAS